LEESVQLALQTDSVRDLPFEQVLDLCVDLGVKNLEIPTGGQSSAPHLKIDELLGDRARLAWFQDQLDSRGLTIAALNCSAWPLHPVVGPAHAELIRQTIELAGRLGVHKVVTMSGCPGDGPADTTLNWIWSTWPDDQSDLLARQWDQAIPFWQAMVVHAADHGVERIAFELHPLQLVYNVPTLTRMRDAVGSTIGANLDPSHLFWQQMDPLVVIRVLGKALYHVHLKDTKAEPDRLAIAGVLDQKIGTSYSDRAWNFRTLGVGHDRVFWGAFMDALRAVGYADVLSIENEDPYQEGEEGVREAAAFMQPLLTAAGITR
jgi:sugar phosphate isomerase/epimerase